MFLALLYHHFFFFNDTATTEIYTLSLHDALPISNRARIPDRPRMILPAVRERLEALLRHPSMEGDRKSTRLNSSHGYISYAVFCLKKKKTERTSAKSRNSITAGVSHPLASTAKPS